MEFLPNELLLHVLQSLSVLDLLACELVCRRWRDAILHSAELWESRREGIARDEGCRVKREFHQILPDPFPRADRVRHAVLKLSRDLRRLDRNLQEGKRRCVSMMAEDNGFTFDVDFSHGRVAIFATRSTRASFAIYDLKTLQFVDAMEIDHLSNVATSIVKLTDDWIIRAVPVIGDRRMWNWRRKTHVTDLEHKAEKATPIVSFANNKLVDLVNRRKEIAVWKLKGDENSPLPFPRVTILFPLLNSSSPFLRTTEFGKT